MEERKNKFVSYFNNLNLEKISNNKIESHKRRNNLSRDEKIHSELVENNENEYTKINFQLLQESYQFIIKKEMIEDKSKIKYYLKTFRKEISKIAINSEILNSLFNCKSDFFHNLALFIFDFKNSEIQLESLWILNNISTLGNDLISKELLNLNEYLLKFIKEEINIMNSGAKNMVLEKFFSLIGNLFIDNDNLLNIFLNNGFLEILTLFLNSSVRSLRSVVIWTLNNIISKFLNDEMKLNVISNILLDKNIHYYLKFILVNLDTSKNFEECFEFMWFLSFLSKIENINLGKIFYNTEVNLIKIINLAFNENLLQPIIRILGNILANTNEISSLKNCVLTEISNPNNCFYTVIKAKLRENFSIVGKDIIWLVKNCSVYNSEFFKIIVFPDIILYLNYTQNITNLENVNSLFDLFKAGTKSDEITSEYYEILCDLIVLLYLSLMTDNLDFVKSNAIRPFLTNFLLCLQITIYDNNIKYLLIDILSTLLLKTSKNKLLDEKFLNEMDLKFKKCGSLLNDSDIYFLLNEMRLRVENNIIV